MNYHIMNVEKEPRNQILYKHDHDNNDHNHEDMYWEHFLETTNEPTCDDQVASVPSSLCNTNSVDDQNLPVAKLPSEFGNEATFRVSNEEATRNVCPLTQDVSGSPPKLCSKQLNLHSRWNYYYHLPNDKNWNLASYKYIMGDIDTLEKLIAVNETVTNNIIKNCMLFVMREGVTPMWEDNCNRNGGCFSYKVSNKVVINVWRELTYLLCGNSLTIDKNHMELVNGITISPKRGFCIVKIWLKNCSLQDPNIVVDVDNLIKVGCLFKTHKAEF